MTTKYNKCVDTCVQQPSRRSQFKRSSQRSKSRRKSKRRSNRSSSRRSKRSSKRRSSRKSSRRSKRRSNRSSKRRSNKKSRSSRKTRRKSNRRSRASKTSTIKEQFKTPKEFYKHYNDKFPNKTLVHQIEAEIFPKKTYRTTEKITKFFKKIPFFNMDFVLGDSLIFKGELDDDDYLYFDKDFPLNKSFVKRLSKMGEVTKIKNKVKGLKN